MQYILNNKKIIGNCLLGLFLVVFIWCFGIKTPAYAVIVDGQQEFVVAKAADVTNALNQLRNEEEASRVICKRTFVSRSQLLASENIALQIKLALLPKAYGAAIVINGQPAVYVENRTVAESILDQLKKDNSPLAPGETLLSVDFKEDVQITEGYVPAAKILSAKDAANFINIGTDTPKVYKVQPGDSLWAIARKNDMYVSDLTQANNLQEDAILALGQAIVLDCAQPLINVVAQVQGSGNVAIPYQTKTLTDNSISGVKVKTEGQNGSKFIAYTATKINGEVESQNISEEKVLKDAVDKVVAQGSRATYQVASRGGGTASGRLNWPIGGSITQGYSSRHTGIDIAGPSGSTISAADGGVVTFAGWQGNYGNFVIIDHGNGLVTRYGHCSKLLVSAGQRVSQGQAIALRGSTGHSTGPHLHFEVLQNGSFRNPMNYLH
jgi:murein DD-endopeptidase MepM/ murein hydrolase activator NlpD